jgi:predicted acetyltransferase
MIQIKKVDSIEQLGELKQQYMNQTTAPLDGMWMTGFFCINDDDYLLQFHVSPERRYQAPLLFDSVINQKESQIEEIKGAFVSTAEPHYLPLCLDCFPQFKVHTLMYQKDEGKKQALAQDTHLQMAVVEMKQLTEVVEFAKNAIGAPEEWLTGYYTNLINRQELHGYCEDGCMVAISECRGFNEYQIEYADLGFIVGKSQRGKGLGTRVYRHLVALAESKGLKPICSTEKGNIGAQKAISRAGLFAGNRIIQFDI